MEDNELILSADELADAQLDAEFNEQQTAEGLDPSIADKAGPTFVEGASEAAAEELEEAAAHAAAGTEVIDGQTYYTPEAQAQANNWNPALETSRGMTEISKQGVLGVVDTALGFTDWVMVPDNAELRDQIGVKPRWEELTQGLSEQPHQKSLRKILGVAIPVMTGSGAISQGLKNLPAFASLGSKAQLATRIGAEIGVDATITGFSSSATDDNIAQMMNEAWGWHIPWATKNTDSTEVKYWKNYIENGMLAGGSEAIGLLFGFVPGAKNVGIEYKPKTPEAAEVLAQKDLDEVVANDAIVESLNRQQQELNLEGQLDEAAFFGPNATDETVNARLDQEVRNSWGAFKSNIAAKNAYLEPYIPEIDALNARREAIRKEMRIAENGPEIKDEAWRNRTDKWKDEKPPEWFEAKQAEIADIAAEIDGIFEKAKASVNDPEIYTGVAKSKVIREAAISEETIRRLEADPVGLNGYDPFINDGNNVAKAVSNQEADPYAAVVDTATMNKYPTLNQRPAPMVTKSFQKKFMQAANGTERATDLHETFVRMPKQIDAIRDGKQILSEDDMQKAVNKLASTIMGTDVKTFAKDLNELKTSIINGQKFLDDESFVMLSKAFKEAFDTVYDPNNVRASAMMVQQAAFDVSDASRVANDLENFTDVTRQSEIAFENLELVASEIRANQYIAGYSLEMKKLVKNTNHFGTAEKLRNHRDAFEANLAAKKAEAKASIQELQRITRDHPEYRRAFTKAFDATNGDVDTLHKLFKYSENMIGVMKKGIIDVNPEVPSLVLQGLNAVRYNNILNGFSPANAAAGSAIGLVAEPISALMGSVPFAVKGDTHLLKRAFATYGGFAENWQRGLEVMRRDWALAVSNPQAAMARGRKDFNFQSLDNLEILSDMIGGWRNEGKLGKVALANTALMLSHWTNKPIMRWGINAMFAIDGFTNSFQASGKARAIAYDSLFEASNGAFKRADFDKMQRKLYSQSFDENGLVTDQAVKYAAGEIALNLDSNIVNGLEGFMRHIPASRAVFMFPRTGVKGLEFGWTFNPMSNLGPAISKSRRALGAKTDGEIIDSLMEHGIEVGTQLTQQNRIAHKALRSEYIGRQMMGTTVVTGTAMWALGGNLTGNGPQDPAERQRMVRMGWKPLSFRIPGTQQWISYRGLGPFTTLMGLTADVVYHADRTDQAFQEDMLRKLIAGIGLNITNQSFLGNFEPLVAMLSGDQTAIDRFMATQVDSIIPGTGVRSSFSKIITPQLKDIERDFWGYLANRNKWLFPSNDVLKDYDDLYTGEPIRYFDPILSRVNALLPFFKMNGGMEPWRQWMLETGWDGLQAMRNNPVTEAPLEPHQRQWINNWIAHNYPLVEKIEKLKNNKADWYTNKIKEYKKLRGGKSQDEFPIKHLVVHDQLDKIHQAAFNAAWRAYTQKNKTATLEGALRTRRDEQLKRGDIKGAKQTLEKLDSILNINK